MTELSGAALMIARAKAIRAKLMSHSGIVDNGIDLQRHKKKLQEEPPVRKVLALEPKKKPRGPLTTNCTAHILLVIKAASRHFSIPTRVLRGKDRTARVVFARQIACYLCRSLTGHSFPKIGKFFNKDHTTMLYSEKKVRLGIEVDPHTAGNVEAVRTIYEFYYRRPTVPTKCQSDMAIKLQGEEGSSGTRVREVDDGVLPVVANPEATTVPDGYGAVLGSHRSGEPGQEAAGPG